MKFIFIVRDVDLRAERIEYLFSFWTGILHPFRRCAADSTTICVNLIAPTSNVPLILVTIHYTDLILSGLCKCHRHTPLQVPLVDPALLNFDFEIFKFAMRKVIKAAQRFAAAPAWEGFVIGPYGNFATTKNDTEFEAYARRKAAIDFYPVRTAAIASEELVS